MDDSLIVFFDGVCSLCNGFVDFLMSHNKNKKLKFASLQGNTAKSYIDQISLNELKTIIVYHKGKTFKKSEAIFLIVKNLGAPWNLFIIFRLIPRFICDAIYDFIARHRYEIFGKKDTCRIPTEDEKSYFLD
ncbi:MAG: DCC1-like thiol-disulfide oxidoreductase family protein [Bdellovibrionales bacterium]|jgi:predicted DCC family thiol-disulfide oxidoreductase YuxK|nr:DCC1-like thiol-disulfide oxidoreductase family protein [Bdellovibrionales bacterium]